MSPKGFSKRSTLAIFEFGDPAKLVRYGSKRYLTGGELKKHFILFRKPQNAKNIAKTH